jgi:hypothetical protein
MSVRLHSWREQQASRPAEVEMKKMTKIGARRKEAEKAGGRVERDEMQ